MTKSQIENLLNTYATPRFADASLKYPWKVRSIADGKWAFYNTVVIDSDELSFIFTMPFLVKIPKWDGKSKPDFRDYNIDFFLDGKAVAKYQQILDGEEQHGIPGPLESIVELVYNTTYANGTRVEGVILVDRSTIMDALCKIPKMSVS